MSDIYIKVLDKSKRNTRFNIVVGLIIIEFFNTYLRGFGMLNMSIGIKIRKLIFVFLFIYLLYILCGKIVSHRSKINGLQSLYLLMFFYFSTIYFFITQSINITEISDLWIPFIVGAIGTASCLEEIDTSWAVKLCVAFCIFGIYIYFTRVINGNFSHDPFGINSIYYIVSLFPLILNLKSKILKVVLSIIIVVTVIISLKSTALLVLVAVFIMQYIFKKEQFSKRLLLLPIILGIAILIALYVFNHYFGIDIYDKFVYANLSDGGDGRLDIWKNVISSFNESSVVQKIFGHGFNAVANRTGLSAHNDFLEILYDYGLIGLMFIVVSFYHMIRLFFRMYIDRYVYAVLFGSLLVELLIFFTFSSIFFQGSFFLLICYFLFTTLNDYRMVYKG